MFTLRHPAHLAVMAYVRDNPGCSKWAAAKAGTRNPLRCPSRQYYLVNTLIRRGYIRAERTKRGAYRLFAQKGP